MQPTYEFYDEEGRLSFRGTLKAFFHEVVGYALEYYGAGVRVKSTGPLSPTEAMKRFFPGRRFEVVEPHFVIHGPDETFKGTLPVFFAEHGLNVRRTVRGEGSTGGEYQVLQKGHECGCFDSYGSIYAEFFFAGYTISQAVARDFVRATDIPDPDGSYPCCLTKPLVSPPVGPSPLVEHSPPKVVPKDTGKAEAKKLVLDLLKKHLEGDSTGLGLLKVFLLL